MAAAYKTGTATNPTDLYAQLVEWLQLQGWALNLNATVGAGSRAHLAKNGAFINLRVCNNESAVVYNQSYAFTGIFLYRSTGFDGAKSYGQQPGATRLPDALTVSMGLPTGALLKYHFFDDGADNITVVAERTLNVFSYLGFGSMRKAGAWNGGAFIVGSRGAFSAGDTIGAGTNTTTAPAPFDGSQDAAAALVRADVDSFVGQWLSLNSTSGSFTGRQLCSPTDTNLTNYPRYGSFTTYQTNAADGSTNLLPVRLYVNRDAGGHSLLGDVPNLFFSNAVGNGYAAGSVLTLGLDEYMLFPGFAVKKQAS